MRRTLALLAAAGLLAACGEQPQTAGGIKQDTSSFAGTGAVAPYTAPGWKQGDKTSWEQHLKVRTQSGQNDYSKVN